LQVLKCVGQGNERRPRPLFPIYFLICNHLVCCMLACLQVLYRVGQGNERRPRPLFPICFCFCDRLVCLQVPKRASQGQVSCLQSPFSLYACMLAGAQTCGSGV
jgi:hypothetical protein